VIRLFILCNLLLLNVYACKGGYSSCIQKINDSKTIQNDSLSIPIHKNLRLIYSKNRPNAKILKYDPFFSLYLVKDKSNFKYPFNINMRLQLGTASVNQRRAIEGKILKHQIGLNTLATFSEKITAPALLTSSCCSLEGIVTADGIIERDYLKRFISSASAEYSDIGIRVKDENSYVVVTASNPYMKENLIKKGDCVVKLNGHKVKNSATFMKKILFSKIGSKHRVEVKRGNKFFTYTIKSTKRDGGGAISDTFLEYRGIYFNKKLEIVELSNEFLQYGLLLGDRLIQVNGVEIHNQDELRKYIEDFKNFSALLFERRNFEFFVNIK